MTDDALDIPDWVPDAGWTGFGALGALWLVGPTVRAVGRNLGRWTDYHTSNLLRLSEKVEKRLRDQDGSGEENVHPRAAREILDAAAWIDDDLHQEYLAGLIIGSRSPEGKDDGMVFYTRIVAGLTASMVRVHHAMYSTYLGSRIADDPDDLNFTEAVALPALTVSATTASWALCASDGDATRGIEDLAVATSGLQQAGLIGGSAYEDQGKNHDRYQLVPTLLGATLYGKTMFDPAVGARAIRWSPNDLLAARPPHYPVRANVTYPPLTDARIQRVS